MAPDDESLSRAVHHLFGGREFTPAERAAVNAVLALMGERFIVLSRRCRDSGIESEAWGFLEAATMVAELKNDLLGAPPISVSPRIQEQRDGRDMIFLMMGVQ